MTAFRTPFTASLHAVACALALHVSAPTLAQAEEAIQFDIASQPLVSALKAFADQADIQLLYKHEAVEHVTANAVVGKLDKRAALEQLLRGTQLEVVFISESAATIRPVGERTSRATMNGLLRLAQTDRASLPQQVDEDELSTAGGVARESRARVELDEVVVTGSHIRGNRTVGAPLIEISREDIRRSGLATTHQILQRLPQNFGGGARENTVSGGVDAASALNFGFGSGVNLRGLGNDSSLVLLDGRRLAPGGANASFVDLSMIPLSAVDRIEVLTDGASAIYGADAVGGVVNVRMRRDFDGAESRIRYGGASGGGAKERQIGQLLGKRWERGNVVAVYEYFDRENLASSERAYTASSDLTPFGGDDFRSEGSNPGNITDFASTFAIPSGQNGQGLTPADLIPNAVNLQNTREGTDIEPHQKRNSLFVTASQEITDRVRAFADARAGRREFGYRTIADFDFVMVPSSNPFFVDPFGGSDFIFVNYSFIDDLGPQRQSGKVDSYGGSLGVTVGLARSWQAQVYASGSREKTNYSLTNAVNRVKLSEALADPDPSTAFNPFGDGSHTNPDTIEAIRGSELQHADADVWTVHAEADGELFQAPGGMAKLAVGTEYRRESFDFNIVSDIFTGTPETTASTTGERDVFSGFAELNIPLVGENNARAGVRRLDVSLAARIEHYSDFGTTTDPRFGISWSPVDGLDIRGTVGSSFKAPLLSQLEAVRNIFLLPVPDPASPTGFTNALIQLGTKENLQPEEAKTWTVGLEAAPPRFPGFRAQLHYFTLDISRRIKVPADSAAVILPNETLYAPIITRQPDAAAVEALFNDPGFRQTPIPPDQVGAIIDVRLSNVASTEVSGLDFSFSWLRDGAIGSFGLELGGTYLLHFRQALISTAPLQDTLGTIANPPDLRLRASASWNFGRFSATAGADYVDAYIDNLSSPTREVSSWTTLDLQLAYEMGEGTSIAALKNVNFALNAQNILDKEPPFANIAGGIGYDGANANALGRVVSVQIGKRW